MAPGDLIYSPKNPDFYFPEPEKEREAFYQVGLPPDPPPPSIPIDPAPFGAVLSEGDFQSPNFREGQSGWRIRSDGSAEFRSIIANVSQLINNYVAGEALTAGDAVFVAIGTEDDYISTPKDDTPKEITAAAQRYSQSFTVRPATSGGVYITQVNLEMSRDAGATGTLTCAIYAASGDQPTGSALATKTTSLASVSAGGSGVPGTGINFTFASPLQVTGGQKYCFVIYCADLAGGNFSIDSSTSTYTGGQLYKSIDSGANWTDQSKDLGFVVDITFATAGRVYKTNAGNAYLADNFVGFVQKTTPSGYAVPVIISGLITGMSGLTVGPYYLADGYGTIQTSAGTVTRKVGRAITTTSLLITNIW